ncbi:hypothetical protein [Blastococcus deserti]|uniref:Uncharacterized protein n=1 Tax=Blastococcus deserti TaxID=2259033 RepID=A0ABW4XGL0_9ACTN
MTTEIGRSSARLRIRVECTPLLAPKPSMPRKTLAPSPSAVRAMHDLGVERVVAHGVRLADDHRQPLRGLTSSSSAEGAHLCPDPLASTPVK